MAGAVSYQTEPQCPLCRAAIADCVETAVMPSGSEAHAVAMMPQSDAVARVESVISPEILSVIRQHQQQSASSGPRRTSSSLRTIRLIQQLQDVQATRDYFEALELAWDAHGNEGPCLLPDTGAKDGLCGEEWAVHAGEWAKARGHQWKVGQLSERRVVRGVGNGSQHADD